MYIQVNTGNNVEGKEDFIANVKSVLEKKLARFSARIMDAEVYFNDVNGTKKGFGDKSCMIQVRLAGLRPLTVTNYSSSLQQALNGAIKKMQGVLSCSFEKQNHYSTEEHIYLS